MGLLDFIKKQLFADSVRETVSTATEPSSDEGSLDSYIHSAFPSRNGLYPHEIMMLSCADSYKTINNSFPNYWKYDFAVSDPQAILTSLHERGFIDVGTVEDALSRLKVVELKEYLSRIGEKTSGKKDELIKRILENYDISELEHTLTERYYALTEKGKKELEENQYVTYLHRHRYMSIWEMNILLNSDNPSHLGYRDILWREFNKRSGEYFQTSDFGLYRNTRLNMHDFLIEEGKAKDALRFLVEVISFDLSGLGNGTKPIQTASLQNSLMKEIAFDSRMANFNFTEDNQVTLPPGIIRYFERIKETLGIPDAEFVGMVYDLFSKIHIHERVFNSQECANIILSEVGIEKRKAAYSRTTAEKRLKSLFA